MRAHRETLEEEATHVTDEARMVLPGVQAVLGFQLVAVFNQRFQEFSAGEQAVHLAAFVLVALAMGLMMTPAAYHRSRHLPHRAADPARHDNGRDRRRRGDRHADRLMVCPARLLPDPEKIETG